MNFRPTLLVTILLAWTSTSCIFSRRATNVPIGPARLEQLLPGETSAQAAVELLGAPTEVVQLGYRSAYRYDRSVTKDTTLFLFVLNLYGSDTRQDRIWLFFDEDEILTHIGSTFAAQRARYKLPWSKLHEQPGA